MCVCHSGCSISVPALSAGCVCESEGYSASTKAVGAAISQSTCPESRGLGPAGGPALLLLSHTCSDLPLSSISEANLAG